MPDGHEIHFSDAALDEYRELLTHYPTRRAALLPALWIAQREFGWLSDAVQRYVASLMEVPLAQVRAVVTFYTMYYQKPVGRWHLEVCANLSCRLRGAGRIIECAKNRLGVEVGGTTADGKFTLSAVECLASCGTAPALQLNHDRYYENLTEESVLNLIDELSGRDD